MPEANTITVATGRTRTELEVNEIHYVLMKRNYANIHMEWGGVYKARITFEELKRLLGDDFSPATPPSRTTVAAFCSIWMPKMGS